MSDKPRFQAVPDASDLATLDRELRFVPRSDANLSPEALSTSDIERFNREGFLSGVRIFSEQEIAAHREYFDGLLARTLADGRDSYSISTAHLEHAPVWDLLTDERIVARVADLIGPDVVGWGSHYFCKMPGDGKAVAWHQDASYWPLTPSGAVTVWLAIDDSDTANGCMRVLRGSHLEGHLAWKPSDEREGNVLNQTIEDVERFGEPVDIELTAGEASIHSDLLVHGSRANTSRRRRCGLTLRYSPAPTRAGLDWHLKGVIVRGADPSGHWSNVRRPAAR